MAPSTALWSAVKVTPESLSPDALYSDSNFVWGIFLIAPTAANDFIDGDWYNFT